MKSFYKFILPAALLILLDIFTPVLATTIYKEKRPSELSDGLYTYALSVKTAVGEMDIELHAKEYNEVYVKRVAQILVEDAPALIEYFGYVPWNTVHFLVDGFVADRISDRANGAATVHPRPLILLYTTPPVGMEHLVTRGDWVRTLVLHELIHILHIDQTAGFMKVLRYLLGSDGKLGGIVPSWFSEGVATWGETKFTNGGRLTRELFNFEYNNRVMEKGFCKTTACLDNPGKHPYGGTRYWYGSHFLKWVEDKKPGSMACIIKNNADNLPFFLHWAFRDCVKEDFQVLFSKYHAETSKRLKVKANKFRKLKKGSDWKHINIKEGEYLTFSNGFESRDGKIFVNMLDKKHNSMIKMISLADQKEENIQLEDIVESILPPVNSSEVIVKTYREYPSSNPTLWKVFSPKKRKLVEEINWSKANYIFKLSNRLIGLIFKRNVWEVWERREGKEEKVFDLPPMTNIFNPEVIEEKGKAFISFRFHDYSQNPENEYLRVDLDTGNVEVLFQSSDSLEVIGSCGKQRVLATKDNYYSLNIQNGYVSNLDDSLKEVAAVTGDSNYTVLLFNKDPRRIYYKKENCEDWLQGHSGIELKREPTSNPTSNKNYLEDKSSYPEWDHYLPHRWGLGYSGGDTTSGWTLSTTLSDPGFVHTLDGQYKFYLDHDEHGGSVTYQHSNDYFDLSANYNKYFVTSNLKTIPDAAETSRALIQKDYYFDWLSVTPRMGYSQGRVIDFLSSRKFRSYDLGVVFATENIHYDDLLRGASVYLKGFRNNTIGRKNYFGYKGKTRVKLHPSYAFDVLLQGTYEKLDKNDLSSGAAYAGGFDDIGTSSFHEFYGIQSNDSFGNEVYSGKFETNYLINESYNGPSYFPLYIRKLHATVGTGFLKSDFVFIDSDKKFLRDKTIANVYAGISSDITLFYLAPLRVDFLMAQLISSEITNKQSQVLVLIKSGL